MRQLQRLAFVLVLIDIITVIYVSYYFHLTKSSPLFWVLVWGLTFGVFAVLFIFARKIIVCPFCQAPLSRRWKQNCPSCGKDLYSDPTLPLPKDNPNQKWEAPAELMVPKPRDLRIGQLSFGATLFRRVLFLMVCGGVWFILHKGGHVPLPIYWLVGLGVLFTFIGIKSMQTHKRIVQYGEPCPGTVTETFRTKNGALARVRYSYQGVDYHRALTIFPVPMRSAGDIVALLIDPEKPSKAIIYPDGV